MLYIVEIFLPKIENKVLYNFNFFLFVCFIFAIIYCCTILHLIESSVFSYSSLVRYVKNLVFYILSCWPSQPGRHVNKSDCLWYPHRAVTLYSISGVHLGMAVCQDLIGKAALLT